jgi:hypothetical protein
MNLNRLTALWSAALCATTLSAQQLPDLYHSESYGDAPFLIEEGWTPLLNGADLTGWFTAQAVWWQRIFNPARLTAKAGPGGRIVNGPNGRTADFVTTGKFGDMELYLEFMTARSSNSGVYIHGLYEVQIFDSYGFQGPLMVGDCAGIYEGEASHGSPPLVNACLAPGAWQSLHIWFKAPRFDTSGKKTSNARILRVLLNGMLVQREFELPGPTLGHLSIPEAAQNPLMLQGDHGAIAFRSIFVRPLSETAH